MFVGECSGPDGALRTMLKSLSLAKVIHQEATELLSVSLLTKPIARKWLLIDDFSQETLITHLLWCQAVKIH